MDIHSHAEFKQTAYSMVLADLLDAHRAEILVAWREALEQDADIPPCLVGDGSCCLSPPERAAVLASLIAGVRGEKQGAEEVLTRVATGAANGGVTSSMIDRIFCHLDKVVGMRISQWCHTLSQEALLSTWSAYLTYAIKFLLLQFTSVLESRSAEPRSVYASVFDLANDAFILLDAKDLTIYDMNRFARELLGIETGERVKGRSLPDFVSGIDEAELATWRAPDSTIGASAAFRKELTWRPKALGRLIYVSVSGTYILHNSHPALLLIVHDVTREKELEKRLKEYIEHLRKASQQRAAQVHAAARITQVLARIAEEKTMFRVAAHELCSLFPVTCVFLARKIEGKYGHVRLAVTQTYPDAFKIPGGMFECEVDEYPGGQALFHNSPVDGTIFDVFAEPLRSLFGQRGLRAFLSLPIRTTSDTIGLLTLCTDKEEILWDPHMDVLQIAAQNMGFAIERHNLVDAERKHSHELEMISEVSQQLIGVTDERELLKRVADTIRKTFEVFDVCLFVLDPEKHKLVLMAQSGAFADLKEGEYVQDLGVGLVGRAAAEKRTIVVNDVSKEPRRIVASEKESIARSELCVPIKSGEHLLGVINVECEEPNAFKEEDVRTIETIASETYEALNSVRLYERINDLNELNEKMLYAVPCSVMVTDADLQVLTSNRGFCQCMPGRPEELAGKKLPDILDMNAFKLDYPGGFRALLADTLERQEHIFVRNARHTSPRHPDQILNISVSPLVRSDKLHLIIAVDDVTETIERGYQVSLIRQLTEAMHSTLDVEQLLRRILTCVTTGYGLAFNRALLFLIDERSNVLRGKMGVGPENEEEAYQIWHELANRQRSLEDALRDVTADAPVSPLLSYLAQNLAFSLDSSNVVIDAIRDRKPIIVENASTSPNVPRQFVDALQVDEFVVVPLISQSRAVGAIIADNKFSRQPITERHIELLTIFANHAGQALELAETHSRLREASLSLSLVLALLEEARQRELQNERLVTLGKVAAHVAHEIRNPLVTIGGFARQILRRIKTDDPKTTRKLSTIVEEISRLERILKEVMDFTKPSKPQKRKGWINDVVKKAVESCYPSAKKNKVRLVVHLDESVEECSFDPDKIYQVLINLMKNAVEMMPDGGVLEVRTGSNATSVWVEVGDTGPGIPENEISEVFKPFFSRKSNGTGIGLAICQSIIEDHGGQISARNREEAGSVFRFELPIE